MKLNKGDNMKKRLEKILAELISDFEVTRENFKAIEDVASQEVAVQALANTLVLMQTSIQNMQGWQGYLNMQEEQKERKLQLKHIALEIKAKEEEVK
jgi:hypothetical protein